MNSTTAELIEWMRGLPDWGIYVFLGVSSAIENIFPPWPGDVPIVFAGFLAAHDVLELPLSFLASMIGNIVSGLFMYYAGTRVLRCVTGIRRRVRWPLLRRWLNDGFSRKQMDQTRGWFARYGALLVMVSRFLAGIRIFVVIVAGVARMHPIVFLVSFTIGVSIWNTLLLGGGYALGENWERILGWIKIYSGFVIGALVLGGGGYLLWRWRAQRPAT